MGRSRLCGGGAVGSSAAAAPLQSLPTRPSCCLGSQAGCDLPVTRKGLSRGVEQEPETFLKQTKGRDGEWRRGEICVIKPRGVFREGKVMLLHRIRFVFRTCVSGSLSRQH